MFVYAHAHYKQICKHETKLINIHTYVCHRNTRHKWIKLAKPPDDSRKALCFTADLYFISHLFGLLMSNAAERLRLKVSTSQALIFGSDISTIYSLIFTAMHGMQTWSSDENSVRLSVRLSNARIVTKQKKNLCRFLYHAKDHNSLVFWWQEWLVGATRFTWNYGPTGPRLSEIAHFQQIIARRASAVTPSEKVQLQLIGSSIMRLQMSLIWSS